MIVVAKARIMFLNCLSYNIWKFNFFSAPTSGSETTKLKIYNNHTNPKYFHDYKENLSELEFLNNSSWKENLKSYL